MMSTRGWDPGWTGSLTLCLEQPRWRRRRPRDSRHQRLLHAAQRTRLLIQPVQETPESMVTARASF